MKKEAAPMVSISGSDKDAVAEARKAINDILRANVDNSTKVEALKTLFNLTGVHNTTLTGCNFHGGE